MFPVMINCKIGIEYLWCIDVYWFWCCILVLHLMLIFALKYIGIVYCILLMYIDVACGADVYRDKG